jgi:Thiamine pyrophosphate enzyme, C-terminal TPP binding domain
MADDFCIDEDAGVAYLTTHRENTIDCVSLDLAKNSERFIVAGDPFTEELIGPSSAARSRIPGEYGKVDNGMYKIWFARNYRTRVPNTLLLDNALATMGAGLLSAVMAKILFPQRRVLAVCGDGGSKQTISIIQGYPMAKQTSEPVSHSWATRRDEKRRRLELVKPLLKNSVEQDRTKQRRSGPRFASGEKTMSNSTDWGSQHLFIAGMEEV